MLHKRNHTAYNPLRLTFPTRPSSCLPLFLKPFHTLPPCLRKGAAINFLNALYRAPPMSMAPAPSPASSPHLPPAPIRWTVPRHVWSLIRESVKSQKQKPARNAQSSIPSHAYLGSELIQSRHKYTLGRIHLFLWYFEIALESHDANPI